MSRFADNPVYNDDTRNDYRAIAAKGDAAAYRTIVEQEWDWLENEFVECSK